MKTLLLLVVAVLLASAAPEAAAQATTPIYNLRRGTNTLQNTNWIAIVTRPNQTNGTERYTLDDLSDYINALVGSGTLSGVRSNGTAISAVATAVNFIEGTNVVFRSTNNAGVVDLQINASGSSSGSANISTNGNQFGEAVPLTLKDGVRTTNQFNQGTLTNNGSVGISGGLAVMDPSEFRGTVDTYDSFRARVSLRSDGTGTFDTNAIISGTNTVNWLRIATLPAGILETDASGNVNTNADGTSKVVRQSTLNTASNALVSYANGVTNSSIVRQTELAAASNSVVGFTMTASNSLVTLFASYDTYTSNALYALIIGGGITAATATNIATYFATNSALITSNQLVNILAPKTNATFYGTLTVDGGTANELVAFNASKALVAVTGISATEAGYLDGVSSSLQTQLDGKQPLDTDLTALAGTGANTNHPNTWQVWTAPSGTNNYFANNRALSLTLFSNDFSGLLQNVAGRISEGGHIKVAGNPAYTNRYVFTNTVLFTNAFVLEGDGNPSTVFVAASGMTGPMIRLGTNATLSGIGGIARLIKIRFEGDDGATNCVGVQILKCAEPVFEYCEWTGFKMAGLQYSSTNYIHWAKVDNCWFVQKWTSSKGILIDASPLEAQAQNHLVIENSTFGEFGGGVALVQSNWFPALTIQHNHVRFSTGAAQDQFQHLAGSDITYLGNEFQNFGSIYPISFSDRGSATNYNVMLAMNKVKNHGSAGPDYLAYIGTFVQGVTDIGNSGMAVASLGLAGNNGSINSIERGGLTLRTLTASRAVIIDANNNLTNSATVSDTELGYLDGVTSAIQTQLNSKGGTNMISATVGNALFTNVVSLITTNLSTNAAVTFDLMGPAIGHYGISGNSTISLTNLVTFTNNAGGRFVDLLVRHRGVAGTFTVSPIGPHAIDWGDGLFLAENSTNRVRIIWDGLQLRGEVSHISTTGSGAFVRSNAPSITSATLITPTADRLNAGDAHVRTNLHANTPTFTNAVQIVASTLAGVGGANTNFTGQVTDDVIYIDAGTTNVNFAAIMGGTLGLPSFKVYLLTNLTATARSLSLSSVTNRWVGLQTYDGVTAPVTITNKHTALFSVMLDGTNAFWAIKQATNGF